MVRLVRDECFMPVLMCESVCVCGMIYLVTQENLLFNSNHLRFTPPFIAHLGKKPPLFGLKMFEQKLAYVLGSIFKKQMSC